MRACCRHSSATATQPQPSSTIAVTLHDDQCVTTLRVLGILCTALSTNARQKCHPNDQQSELNSSAVPTNRLRIDKRIPTRCRRDATRRAPNNAGRYPTHKSYIPVSNEIIPRSVYRLRNTITISCVRYVRCLWC
jgi:hypothetical protein